MYALTGITRVHGRRTALDVDRLELGGEGLTMILGHNGSGKSTLMSLLARQDRPDSGTAAFDGTPLARLSQKDLARRIAFLPQRLPPVAGLTVRELVRLGRFPWRGALGRWRLEDHAAVDRALALTGCGAYADQFADETSGGERQRAWIAMLLAQDAPMLLLDEPTAALDLGHAYEVIALLHRLTRDGSRHAVVVLHDVNLAARYADRIIALKSGRIAFDGPARALMAPEILKTLYGIDMTLLEAGGHPVAAVS